MYSVSITTFNRKRRDRENYFGECLKSYIKGGLFECKYVNSVDVFVGHEPDDWSIMAIPSLTPVHYLQKELLHTDNIMNVLRHAVKDTSTEYHLYLEDDLTCIGDDTFEQVWDFHMQVPCREGFCIYMDSRPEDAATFIKDGYRKEALNTFTAVLMHKPRIEYFLKLYPDGFPQCKAPDHFFGKALLQPTYVKVPGLFAHIGLQSVAHKRCFNKVLGILPNRG